MALLRQEIFPARVISRRGDTNWPPRTCDLTPLDFFVGLHEKPYFEHLKTFVKLQATNIR